MTLPSETTPERSIISVDWERVRAFLVRLVIGVGLVVFWLTLAAATVALVIWIGLFLAKLSFAWILGWSLTVPIILCVWWISYYMAMDFLSEVGIEVGGFWRWLIIPVALFLAPLSFLFGYLAGLGELVRSHAATTLFLSLGVLTAVTALLLILL